MRDAVKRQYQSPLRADQARGTRRALLEAAAVLFAEKGYAATSIDDIAAAAGVGRATVFTSVGGKAALLRAAYDVAIVGDDEQVSLPDRPHSREVMARPDPVDFLNGYFDQVATMAARMAGIHEALHGAAGADPEARELWEKVESDRLGGARHVARLLASKGGLRDGLQESAAADIVWVLNDPGLYHRLVVRRGWSRKRYAEWLRSTARAQLAP